MREDDKRLTWCWERTLHGACPTGWHGPGTFHWAVAPASARPLHDSFHQQTFTDPTRLSTGRQNVHSVTELTYNRNRNIISNIKISYCILYLEISSITKITGITKLLLLLKTSNTIQRLTIKLVCIILCSSVQTNLTIFSFSTLGDTAKTKSSQNFSNYDGGW